MGMALDSPGKFRWWLGGVLLAAVLVAAGMLITSGQAAPGQPIRFSHKLHAKQAKCLACHTSVTKARAAGVPKLADCLDCHEGAQSKTPEGQKEEAKLAPYAEAKKEIPWTRIWRLPAHVLFSHRIHVGVAKVACQTCHGPMESLDEPPTRPLKSLAMNDCIGCHEKWERPNGASGKETEPMKVAAGRRVSTDCNSCHR